MNLLRPLAPFLFALALPAAAAAPAGDRVTAAEVPPQVATAERVGRADPLQPMERMILVLPSKDPAGRARFLAAQQTPGAPEFHRWLTPAQWHERFGARPEDVAAVEAWLAQEGFSVEPGHPGREIVLFSGNAAQVEAAFRTRIGLYARNAQPRVANELPATMPSALAGRVVGVVSMNGFARKAPLSHPVPLMNTQSGHALAPADFATIYGLDSLASQGIDGAGRKIAVIGRTNVNLSDARSFRSYFGLPANDPQVVLNGPDPGIDSDVNEVYEANLDIQWSGATAPRATVLFVVSKSTDVADGVDLSAQYAVEHDVADVATVSFGACEKDLGDAGNAFYEGLWAQAAAQGTSVFVASGDSGAAGCESAGASTGKGLAVNGLSTSPWNTCVGGTQFLDRDSPSTYWNTFQDGTTKKSVKSYIPEAVWNESGAVAGGAKLFAAGGGVSAVFGKPAWQAGPGVPDDGWRDVPDISLAAAGHTIYPVYQTVLVGIYGTSAASPAFAGVAALVSQKAGRRLGNMNPTFYALGAAQYGGTGPAVFHDVTTGDNSVPGVTGYSARQAYDMGAGLGSVDGSALSGAWNAWAAPADLDFLLGAAPGALALAPGASTTVSLSVSTLDDREAVATLTLAGLPSGVTAVFSPSAVSSQGTGYVSTGVPATLQLTAAAGAATGTFPVTLTAKGNGRTRTLTIFLTVSASSAIPAPSGVESQVPVVLDVFGANSSHYTSDLVAVNRSTNDVTVLFRFTGSGATGPVLSFSLPAGRQIYAADVIGALEAAGYTFTGAKLGTLFVTFAGVSDPSLVFAGSRISTPNPDQSVGGAFGTFAAAVPSGTASGSEAWIYGLKRNSGYRSNVAVVHAPGGSASLAGTSPVDVSVQVFDGDSGSPAGAPVTHTLAPGEFWQLNDVLASANVANGYVHVTRTSGSDRVITYGVVNDGGPSGGGTSDGSLIVSGGTEGLVPIVLDIPGTPHYQTEISLTNTGSSTSNVTLVYTPSAAFGGGEAQTASVGIPAGRQIQQANALSWLRTLGMSIPTAGSQGGTLKVTGAVAVARTWNPASSGNGTYGVAYPALDAAHRAASSAWVYGLRQDADVRTNLALADARVGDSSTRDYVVEIYDADTGSSAPVSTTTRTLAGGQWAQINGVLAGAGIHHGYARIRVASGSSDFLAYGVVNDGPDAGTRTSDGSYVPMAVGN